MAPKSWGNLLSALLCALLLWSAVGMIAMFQAAKRICEDRRNGALEMLLTTPLSVRELIEGQRTGLWIAYRPLMRCLVLMNLVIALTVVILRPWTPLEFWIMLQCWGTIICVGLIAIRSQTISQVIWVALNTGRPLLAIIKVVCPPSVLVCFGFFFYSVLQIGWPTRFPQESMQSLWVTDALLVGTAVLAALSGRWDPSGDRLRKNFRWVVQQPLPDPADTRWRRWDITKPYPQRPTRPMFSRV